MIKINLLPYPEELKKAKTNIEFAIFFASVFVLCIALFLWQRREGAIADGLKGEITNLNANIDKLKDVETLHTSIVAEKNNVKARLDAINAVTKVRKNPIRHIDEITTLIPSGVWITKLTLYGSDVAMDCKSISYYDVSNYFNNIKDSKYFEIDKFPSVAEGEKSGDKPVYIFSITCKAKVLTSEEPSKPSEGASAKKKVTPPQEVKKS